MSEIDKYKVPKNVVKIPDGDTGYNMVKKGYNRFIWTWNDAPKNEDDDYNEADATPTKMKYLKEQEETEEQVPGGLSSGLSVEEVAEVHDVTVEEIEDQLAKGTKVETEHTPNMALAAEIALDHLMEDPKYYDHLLDMEKDVESGKSSCNCAEECECDTEDNKVDVEESKIGDGIWNDVSTQEISGMGAGAPMPSGTQGIVGYKSGPLSKNLTLPTQWVADPDDVKKAGREMKNMKTFNDFFKQ